MQPSSRPTQVRSIDHDGCHLHCSNQRTTPGTQVNHEPQATSHKPHVFPTDTVLKLIITLSFSSRAQTFETSIVATRKSINIKSMSEDTLCRHLTAPSIIQMFSIRPHLIHARAKGKDQSMEIQKFQILPSPSNPRTKMDANRHIALK